MAELLLASCSLQDGNASAGFASVFPQTDLFLPNKTAVRKPAKIVKTAESKMNHMSTEASINFANKLLQAAGARARFISSLLFCFSQISVIC